MKKVALVGSGNIGSRHLQGLAKTKIPLDITVVDNNAGSLEIAKARFEEIPGIKDKRIRFIQSLHGLDSDIDLAIIATSSNIRAGLVRELAEQKSLKALLLEKVVFQKYSDFKDALRINEENGIRCWVNCPRRYYEIYRDIKKKYLSGSNLCIIVNGGNWGLGCNSIHYVDLMAYLSGSSVCEVNFSSLNKGFIESKRKGYVEFSGTLTVSFVGGSTLILHAENDSNTPPVLTLTDTRNRMILDETGNTGYVSKELNSWKWETLQFRVPYQSELTNLIVEDILQTGDCGLVTLRDSAELHRPLLEAFCKHLESSTGKRVDACPIT